VRVLDLLEHLDVVELDVEVLVDALEDAADLDVVLELDRDLVVDKGFEEAASSGSDSDSGMPVGGDGGGVDTG